MTNANEAKLQILLPFGDFGLDLWDPGLNIMFNCVRECVEPKNFLHVDKIKLGAGSIIDCLKLFI